MMQPPSAIAMINPPTTITTTNNTSSDSNSNHSNYHSNHHSKGFDSPTDKNNNHEELSSSSSTTTSSTASSASLCASSSPSKSTMGVNEVVDTGQLCGNGNEPDGEACERGGQGGGEGKNFVLVMMNSGNSNVGDEESIEGENRPNGSSNSNASNRMHQNCQENDSNSNSMEDCSSSNTHSSPTTTIITTISTTTTNNNNNNPTTTPTESSNSNHHHHHHTSGNDKTPSAGLHSPAAASSPSLDGGGFPPPPPHLQPQQQHPHQQQQLHHLSIKSEPSDSPPPPSSLSSLPQGGLANHTTTNTSTNHSSSSASSLTSSSSSSSSSSSTSSSSLSSNVTPSTSASTPTPTTPQANNSTRQHVLVNTGTSGGGGGGGGGHLGSNPMLAGGGNGTMMDYHHHQAGSGGGHHSHQIGHGHHGSGGGGGHHLGAPQQGGGMLGGLHPGMPPSISAASVAAVVTAASSSPSSDPKDCIEEQCPVCGDRVSGYHYGLLTCESCKGFFKRTVQNKKVYTCVADRNCHIDKSQRKRCPYCRFQKCLDVGMKLEAVRADRMRGGRNKFGPMYKRDRARRLQLIRQKQLSKAHLGHGAGNGLVPPGATMLSGDTPLNFLSGGPPGSAAAAAAVAHTAALFGDGVKPELIQIPQLSSSTSSPDSSPSPGALGVPGAVAAAAAAAGHHFMTPLGLQGPMGQAAANVNPVNPNLLNANNNNNNQTAQADHVLKWTSGGGAGGQVPPGPSRGGHLPGETPKIPNLVRELQVSMPGHKDWQNQLFGLLQNQTYNQCEVDLFELMCKVIDQSLFAQVDWARNSIFFKDLKVDDQMKLLQHAWSDMLVLDHIHQRLHENLPDEYTLPNGQKFDLLSLALLGVTTCADQLHRVSARLQELKVDPLDYICLKFLLLLNPEVRGLTNYKLVLDAHEQTKQALHEYTIQFYPQVTDKFNHLLALVPEIRALTVRGEDFLYYKHMSGLAPTQTLLMEMLHAKKK